MKRFWKMSLAVLLISAVCAPAFAWEFSMTGMWEYRLRYLGRTGGTDLFGIAGLQNAQMGVPVSPSVGFAGPSIYNRGTGTFGPAVNAAQGAFLADASNINVSIAQTVGAAAAPNMRIVKGGYSQFESDAFWSDTRLVFHPVIKLNEAIRVHGVYNVGGYRHKYFQAANGFADGIGNPPLERYYMSQTSQNAYDTAALGSWEQFRATIQLPIATLSLGVKDFPFGLGSSLGYNTRAEAFLTVVPYGPFRFLHGLWLSRGLTGGQESWNTSPDSGSRNSLFQGLLATYDQGPLSWGAGGIWRQTHMNRIELLAGLQPAATSGMAYDINTLIWLMYAKYNNGRFFTNAEYAWLTVDFYRAGNIPRYDEAYHWFWELGMFSGPAKVTLLWAQVSGSVLNLYNRDTPFTPALPFGPATGTPNGNQTKNYRPWAMNWQAMEGYQFLMFEQFAGGNNGGWAANDVAFVNDEHGSMTDAFCFAGRVDYAVASNLNVFGSYIWAHRLERAGAFAGGINSAGGAGAATPIAAQAWKSLATGQPPAGLNPYPNDGFIGWEVNLGCSWKLLEGLNLNTRYSYWKPGEWFDEAYQAVGMRFGVPVDNALVTGRSPIQAITGSMVIDF